MAPIDITPEKNGGVLKEIKKEGQADCKPLKGNRVHVHYVGTLEADGSKFDSSRDRGAKFSFNLGRGEVIKGWDIGVASMNKGELAVFTIKAEYGYGATGSPPKIPGGATLVFEVELFDFEGEDITKEKSKGVIKQSLTDGEGLDHPNEGALVEIHVKGVMDGKTFDDRDLKFTLGEGLEFDLPSGLELALEKMKKKEICRVDITPSYGFGASGCSKLNIPPNAKLQYDIELKAFERAKESWQLDGEQKLEQSKLFKDRGTEFFKKGKYETAAKKYKKVIEFLEHEISLTGDKETDRRAVLQAGRLNLAMCSLKLNDWIEARNVCDKVLDENPDSEKAFFRRGEALLQLNDHEQAKISFEQCLKLDPENKAAKNRVAVCQAHIKKQKDKERKTFANMFDKFAAADARKEENARRNQKPLEINEWSEKERKEAAAANGSDVLKVTGDVQMDMDLSKEMAAADASA